MNIINNNLDNFAALIAGIDEDIILEIINVVLKCKKHTERDNIRDYIYCSKYHARDLEQYELRLEKILKTEFGDNVRLQDQNKEYKWVNINTHNMGTISDRFYIAPDPKNLHQLVEKLTKSFVLRNVPVRFKYQLTTNMEHCDRIIIYSDYQHNKDVQEAIKAVYEENMQLFEGCERSIAWFYKTSIPGVYIAPETKGDAYSNIFSDAILEAKYTFNFLYGLNNSNSNICLSGKDAERAMEYMKFIVPSIMFRKGLLKTKDGRTIQVIDKNIRVKFDYDTGILSHSNSDERGYYEVRFDQSFYGKDAMLKNFYSVSTIKPQYGLHLKYQTPQERAKEIDRILYPHKYENQTTQNNGNYSKK